MIIAAALVIGGIGVDRAMFRESEASPGALAVPGSPTGFGDAELTDISGVGTDTRPLDFLPGVYVATVYGDTLELAVVMEHEDGRHLVKWGRVPAVSFAVGDHPEATLYPGTTIVTVTTPEQDTQWGILFERHPFP